MRKYPSYCCQKCGENVGFLGKIVEFIYYKIFRIKMFKHDCKNHICETCGTINLRYDVTLTDEDFWPRWAQRPEIQEVLYPEFNIKKRITKHKFIKNG